MLNINTLTKNLLCFFFLFCNFQKVFATENSKIDSIRQVLKNTNLSTENQIESFHELARNCLVELRYKEGFLAIKQAKDLAKKNNYELNEALEYRTLSIFHYSFLNTYYDFKSRGWYRKLRKTESIHFYKMPELNEQYYESSNKKLLEDLAFFQANADYETQAHFYFALFVNFRDLGNAAMALKCIKLSHESFNKANLQESATILLPLIMSFAYEKGDKKLSKSTENEILQAISSSKTVFQSAMFGYFLCRMLPHIGKRTDAIKTGLKVNADLEKIEQTELHALVLENLAQNFSSYGMAQNALAYFQKSANIREKLGYLDEDATALYFNIGFENINIGNLENAKINFEKGKALANKMGNINVLKNSDFRYNDGIGQILIASKQYEKALQIYDKVDEKSFLSFYAFYFKALCFQKLGRLNESLLYAQKSLIPAITFADQKLLSKLNLLLSEVNEQFGNTTESFEYLKKYFKIRKEIDEKDISNSVSKLEIQSIIDKNQKEKEHLGNEKQKQQWWLFAIGAALLLTCIILIILYRNNIQKKKANVILNQQKTEINIQKNIAEKALIELKNTQKQLIQKEKMASLGELTAGIAHEIQNPLNFVNSFSELSVEFLDELKSPLSSEGEIQNGEKIDMDLFEDIIQNLQKINHHGKRASNIVKGMLEHSNSHQEEKKEVDINEFVIENFNLSYTNFKLKNNAFQVKLITEFASNLTKTTVYKFDLGKVFTNIFNNAFYAINEKSKKNEVNFEPSIKISTVLIENVLQILIQDNGTGINSEHLNKIFQPFFTTKPTGQGIGLGLSLAHEIIVKGHEGEILAESIDQSGTTFKIYLKL